MVRESALGFKSLGRRHLLAGNGNAGGRRGEDFRQLFGKSTSVLSFLQRSGSRRARQIFWNRTVEEPNSGIRGSIPNRSSRSRNWVALPEYNLAIMELCR